MKRLITILLSFIGCISLYGQAVPMVVAGDVYINGPMYSTGQVNVYAALTKNNVDTGKIYIANTSGAMLKTDTVILYSDDKNDGLLMNNNTYNKGVQGITANATSRPTTVILRKNIANAVFTYMSLPFNVSAIKNSAGTNLVGGTDYWVYGFDAKFRSDSSKTTGKVWKELTYSGGPSALKKATGYQIWYEPGGPVDFITTNPNEIDTLFSEALNKSINFPVYATDVKWDNPEYGDGWGFIGGLSSTTYTLSKDNILGYLPGPGTTPADTIYRGSTVWVRMQPSSQSTNATVTFQAVSLLDGGTIKIAPYSPFYIQVMGSGPGTVGQGTFTYKPLAGLSLESSQYRSMSNDDVTDRLNFAITSDKDNSFGHFYLAFSDKYIESYRASEDAMMLSTSFVDQPALWCLQDGTNQALFRNGLPMKKTEREVKVGFSAPKAGDYTISLNPINQQDVKNVILVDNVTGKKIDLLQYSYTFTSGTVKDDNGRFVLYINSSYTGTPSINSAGLYAYAKDNILTIKNLSEGDRVQILDLSGRTVASGRASGKEFSVALSQKGVYVVNVTGGKSSVLKVLNR